jgi:hypothetical protein
MRDFDSVLKLPQFRWLPKHLNHIAENIVFKERNISFLAINAIFRQRKTHDIIESPPPYEGSYIIEDFVDVLPSDRLRTTAERLKVVFHVDRHNNIIVLTAYSENDKIS